MILILVLLTPLLFLLYRYLVYPALLSPLSKIPNAHWTAPYSPAWILLTRLQLRENRVLRLAHQRLGPYIRLGPKEISINDIDGVKIVYQGGFEKHAWYSVFDNYGVPCMFSTTDNKEHSVRKRMVSNVYSKSYIHSSKAASAQASIILNQRLLPILDEATEPGREPHVLDVHSLFLATTMDFISAFCYGIRSSTNFLKNKGYREHWLRQYTSRHEFMFYFQEIPRVSDLMARIGWPLYKWVDGVNEELSEWNRHLCDAAMASGRFVDDDAPSDDPADEPVAMKALLAGIEKEKQSSGERSIVYPTAILQRDLSVASELFDHVLAGQETAGITLTYVAWRLSQNQAVQKALRDELATLQPSMKRHRTSDGGRPAGGDIAPSPKALDTLEVLHAVVMETLRLHAAIPGPQPRRAPSPSCTIGPYIVPGGTRVAALAHTLHRDEKVFPDPERWDHARWLIADEEAKRAMNRQFWAFGSGGRMCIGSNFAMNEMKLIVAAIYSNYATFVDEDHGMEQTDGYTATPQAGNLYLRLERLH